MNPDSVLRFDMAGAFADSGDFASASWTGSQAIAPFRRSDGRGELLELVRRLQSGQPLRRDRELRDLAREALGALQERSGEDVAAWGDRLVGDVVGAID